MSAVQAEGVRVCVNPRAAPSREDYGTRPAAILDDAGFTAAEEEISGWPGYAPTPLVDLPGLASKHGIAQLLYKDESKRFTLNSFKALGGAYAVFRLLAREIENRRGARVSSREIIDGAHRDLVKAITVTCATDGNHGRAVAWGAQLFGCNCVIFVHENVSDGRCTAIERYGARVERVPGNYDDSVRHSAAEAARNGWHVVSDTTWEGYRQIPIDVMHGYGVMAREIIRQIGNEPPTHVFAQAGVGALAASLCAAFWLEWGERRPRLVVVEPMQADCFFRSVLAGRPVAVHGPLDTVMAGLACGEVSPAAWEILSSGANACAVVDDRFALGAVRAFAHPLPGDPAVVSGETGGSGLALLLACAKQPVIRGALALYEDSRVLLIGSEGDTDPEIYRRIVGEPATQVQA